MNIYGTGVDIIEVKRVKKAIEKFPGFLKRVYTRHEIDYCENKKNASVKFTSYAQRFAAKEAVAKAMGTGLGRYVFFSEIEITNLESGKPCVSLHGRSKDFCSKNLISGILISLTGTKDYGAAFAVALKD